MTTPHSTPQPTTHGDADSRRRAAATAHAALSGPGTYIASVPRLTCFSLRGKLKKNIYIYIYPTSSLFFRRAQGLHERLPRRSQRGNIIIWPGVSSSSFTDLSLSLSLDRKSPNPILKLFPNSPVVGRGRGRSALRRITTPRPPLRRSEAPPAAATTTPSGNAASLFYFFQKRKNREGGFDDS